MSQENVELTQAGYEAFNRGDIDGPLAICAPDVEWHDAAAPLDTSAVTGKDAVRAFFETVMEPWEEIRREPDEIIDIGGDRVLVLFTQSVRGKGSGIEVDAQAGDLLTFREGRLARWIGYTDRAQALAAVGLSEQDAHADS
jgi:ketosteroid isomerase-like protein